MAAENQNSLDDLIGILGDLGTNLKILNQETPEVHTVNSVDDLIERIKELHETFKLFQDEVDKEPIDEVINTLNEIEVNYNLLNSESPHFNPESAMQVSNNMKNLLSVVSEGNILVDGEERKSMFNGAGKQFENLYRSLAGLTAENDDFLLTYVDVIILAFFILGFFFILGVSCIMFNYCWRRLAKRKNWRELSQSETDSSVSWISIDTTNTEDTPVKTPVMTPVKTPVMTSVMTPVKNAAVETAKLSPIPCGRIELLTSQFVLDRKDGQWYRTEISPSIIV